MKPVTVIAPRARFVIGAELALTYAQFVDRRTRLEALKPAEIKAAAEGKAAHILCRVLEPIEFKLGETFAAAEFVLDDKHYMGVLAPGGGEAAAEAVASQRKRVSEARVQADASRRKKSEAAAKAAAAAKGAARVRREPAIATTLPADTLPPRRA